MQRSTIRTSCLKARKHPTCFWLILGILLAAGSAFLAGQPTTTVGGAAGKSKVPAWDARGIGPLPWQGIACVDMTADGKFVAVGTIAPPGDPNVFLLGNDGKVLDQHTVGQRWINEVAVTENGAAVAALCTSPTGAAGDPPRIFAFAKGQPAADKFDGFAPQLFHYNNHSNHLARSLATQGKWLVAGVNRGIQWTAPGSPGNAPQQVNLPGGTGTPISMANSASGRVVVGAVIDQVGRTKTSRNLVVLEKGKSAPVWARDVADQVEAAPELPEPHYGPPAPPVKDFPAWAPLAVAIDSAGKTVAAADYQGWERVLLPKGKGLSLGETKPRSMGVRFTPSRPTINVYDADGKVLRRFGPETFKHPFWCDLAFSADGQLVLAFPHNWTSRGLGGQPFLPVDDQARSLYVLDVKSGKVLHHEFPDAVSDVATGPGDRFVVGCWNGHVYELQFDPKKPLPQEQKEVSDLGKMDFGGPTKVRVSHDGDRILVAAASGAVTLYDAAGKQVWKADLNKEATPGAKPWTKNQKASKLGAGLWVVNSGRTPSDLGNQYVIEAPEGLILIDPNAGFSIEQNWARIKDAGLDPMKVKYVLATHEHGDHAPGAALWRVITGAKFVCSPEMAYTLQHDIPETSGYGFHPPLKTDLVVKEDKWLNLAGMKVKALRLPGHTYGSMGWYFETGGKSYVSIGDLIMPGGVLGYSGSLNFKAADVLASLKKLDSLKPDVVLGGHGLGDPAKFLAAGIATGEATGWGKMKPLKPDPLYKFLKKDYRTVAWLEKIATAAFGDIDGDGRPDVAVLTESPKGLAVQIYLNQKGKFSDTPDSIVDVPGLSHGSHLRMAHVNKDGIADFLVCTEQGAALLISEKGKLDYRVVPLPGLTRAVSLAVGDFNGDGLTDCLIGQRFVQGYTVAYQQKDGSFKTVAAKGITRSYLDLQLVDVNGDGRPDLVTSAGELFLRQPDGTLPEKASLTLDQPFGSWCYLGVGDFDGDGRPDIVLLGKAGDNKAERSQALVFPNTGNAAQPFAKTATATLDIGGPGMLLRDGPTVGDWNGDGVADLIVAAEQGKEAVVFLGAKGAGLSAKSKLTIPLDYRIHYDTRLGLGDFADDGSRALAGFGTTEAGAPGVYIWLPSGAPKK